MIAGENRPTTIAIADPTWISLTGSGAQRLLRHPNPTAQHTRLLATLNSTGSADLMLSTFNSYTVSMASSITISTMRITTYGIGASARHRIGRGMSSRILKYG